MILRIAKVVVEPQAADSYVRMFSDYADGHVCQQPGNLAVRLFRDKGMRNKFFVHSWWDSQSALNEVAGSDAYARMVSDPRGPLLERISIWELNVIDVDPRQKIHASPTEVVSRLIRVAVQPGHQAEMLEEYHRITDHFTRKQDGCLCVQLFSDRSSDHLFFLQSYWSSAQALTDVLRSPELSNLRFGTLRYLEERMRVWNMDLIKDDDRQPIFVPTGKGDAP